VCQDGCDFIDYNYTSKKVICSCNVKESSISSEFMNINITELYKKFKDFENIANIKILSCYKVLFSKKGIKKNIGFFIIIPFKIMHFICLILFYNKDKKILERKINDIIYALKYWHLVKDEEKERKKHKKGTKPKIKRKKMKKKNNPHKFKNNENFGKINKANRRYRADNINHFTISINNEVSNIQKKNREIKKKVKFIMSYTAQELNNLEYKFALKYDNRKFCIYYFSLIKTKHSLMNSFCYKEDYNSTFIKIDLFFIGFVMNYTINALFFNDETMHKIYIDKGKYEFIYQLPTIIYSTLISIFFDKILKFFALSETAILDLKSSRNNIDVGKLKDMNLKLRKKIFIKTFLYFTISTFILLFYWYYLALFCAIYVNTQIHLVKDTAISFGLNLLTPFVVNLLPGIFRIPSLSNKNNKKSYLYTISKFLQLF